MLGILEEQGDGLTEKRDQRVGSLEDLAAAILSLEAGWTTRTMRLREIGIFEDHGRIRISIPPFGTGRMTRGAFSSLGEILLIPKDYLETLPMSTASMLMQAQMQTGANLSIRVTLGKIESEGIIALSFCSSHLLSGSFAEIYECCLPELRALGWEALPRIELSQELRASLGHMTFEDSFYTDADKVYLNVAASIGTNDLTVTLTKPKAAYSADGVGPYQAAMILHLVGAPNEFTFAPAVYLKNTGSVIGLGGSEQRRPMPMSGGAVEASLAVVSMDESATNFAERSGPGLAKASKVYLSKEDGQIDLHKALGDARRALRSQKILRAWQVEEVLNIARSTEALVAPSAFSALAMAQYASATFLAKKNYSGVEEMRLRLAAGQMLDKFVERAGKKRAAKKTAQKDIDENTQNRPAVAPQDHPRRR